MDRRLKERLVGAIVLVVIMIVVVPLFLDGPAHNRVAPRETVSESVDLAPTDRRPHVIQLDAPTPTATAAPGPASERQPTAEVSEPTPGQAAPARPPRSTGAAEKADPGPAERAPVQAAPAVASQASGWAVQVGSFSSEKNARGLVADLRGKQYSAFHVRKNIEGRILFRVLIGPEQNRERAEALARRLRDDGLPTTIVQHP